MKRRTLFIFVVVAPLVLAMAIGSCSSSKKKEEKQEEVIKLDPVEKHTDETLPDELKNKFKIGGSSAVEEQKKEVEKVAEVKKEIKKQFVIPNRRPVKDPIWVGEELAYEVTYFGVAAGHFTLKVLPHEIVNGRKVYHLQGNATTSKLFSMFYQMDDMVETFWDYVGLYSHRFHLSLNETKQKRDSIELNDSENKQTFYWNRWNHYKKGYIEIKEYKNIPQFPQDSLSALYYMRTILPKRNGEKFSFPVVSEGKYWEGDVTVVRREMMRTCLGRVSTIVVKPEAKYAGVLKKEGDSFIWFTDDDRRHVVRLEAKVKIGTVVAKLIEVKSEGERP